MSKKFFITTAIAYLNGPPHIGHALEIIQADCVARFYRLIPGLEVVFQTGSDEHGAKVFNSAKSQNMEIMEFLNKNHAAFVDMYKKLNISYDKYVRTTDAHHKKGAQKLWMKMVEAGDIYKDTYQGLYCEGCESNKILSELENGKCPLHPNRELVTINETNYFFRLSKYRDQLLKIIQNDEYEIVPEVRKNEIVAFLQSELRDVSFSREKSKLSWGIPVPNDQDHVMYVWCDALSNYITNVGYEYDEKEFQTIWPADIHVIGKDITRFHAIYWPAMLLSAGVALPKKLFVHAFIKKGDQKIGKSVGNVIDPIQLINRFGVDSFRFFLVKEIQTYVDGYFSEELLIDCINNVLGNDLGNLIQRVGKLIEKDLQGVIPKYDVLQKEDLEIIERFNNDLIEKMKEQMGKFHLSNTIELVWQNVRDVNKYINDQAPWNLLKKGDMNRYKTVIYTLVQSIRNITILLKPFIPESCDKINQWFGFDRSANFSKIGNLESEIQIGKKINITGILYPKIKPEEEHPASILDFKIGLIETCEKVPDSDKLVKMQVDFKTKKAQVIAGIAKWFQPSDLIGTKHMFLTNIKPSKLAGLQSEAMIIAAEDESINKVSLVEVDGEPGEQIFVGKLTPNPQEIKMKRFEEFKLISKNGHVYIDDMELSTKKGPVKIDIKDGIRLF